MPCQYCSFPQTKGEWWDGGFGLVLLSRTKWRQIMKKLWTLGNGPSGACWGHHLEMCYSSYTLRTNTWLIFPSSAPLVLHFNSIYRTGITDLLFSYCDSLAQHASWGWGGGGGVRSERTCGGRWLKRHYAEKDQICSGLSGVGVSDMCPCAADQGAGVCAFITAAGCSPYGFMWSPGICGGVSPCWNGSVL